MFDPDTVIAHVRYPWPFKDETLLILWHHDPCRDGSDDSCGWSYPKLGAKRIERIRSFAWHEGHYPYFLCCPSKQWNGTRTEAETLYRALVLLTARAINMAMTWDEASLIAAERIHNGGMDDASGVFCWVPGYHCNGADSEAARHDRLALIMCGLARELLRRRRHWWQHPRWHVWHWRPQFCLPERFRKGTSAYAARQERKRARNAA